MNREIEEMAVIIAKQNCKPCGCENCDFAYEYGTKQESCEDYASYYRMAEAFFKKGYRKSSTVATEIFNKIERLLDDYSTAQCYQGEVFVESYFERGLGDAIAELRKKYESEGAGR